MLNIQTKNIGKYDVVVVGGGPSGCHAAISAGRLGAKVLLIEQFGFLGGALTAMGVGPMMTFHNKAGKQLVFGTPQEMVDRLISKGASPGHVVDTTSYCATVTPFDAETLKVVLEEMILEAGVEILFHTRVIHANCSDKKIQSVFIHNRGGIQELEADQFVEATGDGELVKLSNAPSLLGREKDNKTQPLTMNAKVGNVNSELLRAFIKKNWDQFDDEIRSEEKEAILDKSSRVSLWGFYDLWEKAKAEKKVTIPRDNVLFFETNTAGEFIFNTSRILGCNIEDPKEMSLAEIEGRKQCAELIAFLKRNVPGFEDANLLSTAAHIGVREGRHPFAKYVLTAHDIVEQRKFEHPIAIGGYPIDIHSPDGGATDSVHMKPDAVYSIPMESLLMEEASNLTLCGRCIGADHEASAAIRVTPIAMSIGQAAGVIAGLAATLQVAPSELKYKDVSIHLSHLSSLVRL